MLFNPTHLNSSMVENFQLAFGEFIRARRIEIGLSQEMICDVLNISRPTLIKIEAGKAAMLFHHYLILHKILDIDIETAPQIYSKAKFNDAFAKLPEDTQKIISLAIERANEKTVK